MHNFTYIFSHFFEWSLQGYVHLLGFWFWPIVFTTVGGYIYMKQQSVVAWAIGMLILIAIMTNAVVGVNVWFSIMHILVSLVVTGLFLVFITKYRSDI